MSGYPDGPPVEMRHVMDHASGLHAAMALVAALHQRRRTGCAQHVDLAAREVASAMLGEALLQAACGEEPQRPGNGDLAMAPHGVYATAQPDRWLTLAVRDDAQWQALLAVLGQGEAAADARYATSAQRLRAREELDALLARWLSQVDADRTAERLQQAGVCAHVSWSAQDLVDDPHLRARGALTHVSGPGVAPRWVVGAPVRFSATQEVGIRRLTPELGQDEDYVFGELLGLSRAEREALQAREVIL
jgi:crotonobetainyl-CoA:carnitine CoA-transferase CaiB-like acyl-CoA transferase